MSAAVFNQKSLYKAYKKRADNISVDMEEYQKQKESDPDFYRDGSCLEYGKVSGILKRHGLQQERKDPMKSHRISSDWHPCIAAPIWWPLSGKCYASPLAGSLCHPRRLEKGAGL